jgi:O-antigen ligase
MEQIRFAPVGHDPNDVARFLGFAFPIAAMLADEGKSLPGRLLAFGYFPVGFAAILLTASRSGFAIALVALGGCALLLVRRHPKSVVAIAAALVLLMVAAWASVPRETLDRIETISDQLQGGDLNQRVNIWSAGWSAFLKAPFFGRGMGTFVSAAGVASDDTAHNTALALAVEGGLCGLALAFAVLAAVVYSVWQTRGSTRIGLGTAILVWVVSSQVATVAGNRATWLFI